MTAEHTAKWAELGPTGGVTTPFLTLQPNRRWWARYQGTPACPQDKGSAETGETGTLESRTTHVGLAERPGPQREGVVPSEAARETARTLGVGRTTRPQNSTAYGSCYC